MLAAYSIGVNRPDEDSIESSDLACQSGLARPGRGTRARRNEGLVRTDPLTGLLNRRGLDEALAHGDRRAAGRKARLSVLMIDLDDFRSVNKVTYAHGDMSSASSRASRGRLPGDRPDLPSGRRGVSPAPARHALSTRRSSGRTGQGRRLDDGVQPHRQPHLLLGITSLRPDDDIVDLDKPASALVNEVKSAGRTVFSTIARSRAIPLRAAATRTEIPARSRGSADRVSPTSAIVCRACRCGRGAVASPPLSLALVYSYAQARPRGAASPCRRARGSSVDDRTARDRRSPPARIAAAPTDVPPVTRSHPAARDDRPCDGASGPCRARRCAHRPRRDELESPAVGSGSPWSRSTISTFASTLPSRGRRGGTRDGSWHARVPCRRTRRCVAPAGRRARGRDRSCCPKIEAALGSTLRSRRRWWSSSRRGCDFPPRAGHAPVRMRSG